MLPLLNANALKKLVCFFRLKKMEEKLRTSASFISIVMIFHVSKEEEAHLLNQSSLMS